MKTLTKACLQLFSGVHVEESLTGQHSEQLLRKTLPKGYLFSNKIPVAIAESLVDEVERVLGLSANSLNNTFHKSFSTVEKTPLEVLYVQQALHYLTTYGFSSLGMNDDKTVYIPNEKLDIPELTENRPLLFIRPIDRNGIIKGLNFFISGVALSAETMDNICTVLSELNIRINEINEVKNRELTIRLVDVYGDVLLKNGTECLRYLVYKTCGETLLIKNPYLIGKIASSKSGAVDHALSALLDRKLDLAGVFLRYKPLFLALRKKSNNRSFFNRLRKIGETSREIYVPNYLGEVTSLLSKGSSVGQLLPNLESSPVQQLVRLAQSLKFRISGSGNIAYRIRNGKSWVEPLEYSADVSKVMATLDVVLSKLADKLNIKGKTFYIPAEVSYPIFSSEKQFVGNYPYGTTFTVNGNLVIGAHWYDVESEWIDLDMSLVGENKLGWDAEYRNLSKDSACVFSGDMTCAPRPDGATEAFCLSGTLAKPKLIFLNVFTGVNYPIDTTFFIASDDKENMSKNYIVDPNKVAMEVKFSTGSRQMLLGVISQSLANTFSVTLVNRQLGNSKSVRINNIIENFLNAYRFEVANLISLKEILVLAGAKVVSEKPEYDHVDLSPMRVSKADFLSILGQ